MQAKKIENNIEDKLSGINNSLKKTKNELQDCRQKILDMKNEQVEIYQKIATIYLLESPKNDDIQIQHFIQQLQKLSHHLKDKSGELDHVIEEYNQKMADVLLRLDELTTKKVLQLESDADYVSLFNHYNDTKIALTKETKNYEVSQQEFSTKLAQYKQNRYYNYLIKRQFGKSSYKGFWVFRNLDSWVARFINFSENYKNQTILEALIKESQLRFENKTREYEQALKQKEQKEYEVEKKLKLPELKVELVQTEQDLANVKKQKHDIEKTLEEVRSGESFQFRTISNQLAKLFQEQSFNKLANFTSQTVSLEDDALLENILLLNKKIKNIEMNIITLLKTIRELENTYNRFEQALYIFKENNIPSSIYEFNLSSSKLDDLLNSLFNSRVFPESIIQTLLAYRVVKQQTHSSGWSVSSSSSSRSSSWRSSSRSSGFRSSSSSGGGGFKTTNSF